MRLPAILTAAALAILPFAAVAQEHPEKIHVHDAYARLSPQSGAVFFMIHNNTEADITLVGAHTDLAEKAELHTHTEGADGVMVMGKIEGGVALASGEMHEFARGGDHVMLMGLTRKLADGDSFDLVLDFADGSTIGVPVIVDSKRKPGEVMEGMEGMDHDAMHQKMHGSGASD